MYNLIIIGNKILHVKCTAYSSQPNKTQALLAQGNFLSSPNILVPIFSLLKLYVPN